MWVSVLLGEGRAGWGCAQRLRDGALAAIELLDQAGEQAPEERVARIAADAAELSSAIDQHENRREALAANEGQVSRHRFTDIDAAQRRAPALVGLVVSRRDFAVEPLAPRA